MSFKRSFNTHQAMIKACNDKYKENNKKLKDYVDLLRMAGVLRDRKLFSNLENEAPKKNSKICRELGKYYLLIESDYEKSRYYFNKAIEKNKREPLWVYYFSDYDASYYTKISNEYYFTAIPKNGSTTFKSLFLKIISNKDVVNPHQHYDNPFFMLPLHKKTDLDNGKRILITRDPSKRFFSYYRKNIIEMGSLEKEFGLKKSDTESEIDILGMSSRPSLDFFCKNFWSYCYAFNDVFHHLLPQEAYIDKSRKYDYSCDIGDLDNLTQEILCHEGIDIEEKVERRMVSSSKNKSTYDMKAVKFSCSIYADDYALLNYIHGNNVDEKMYAPAIKSFCP